MSGQDLVKLNRIYTRTGDDGTTGLVTGERRAKHDLRIETFGTVDEVNACIGLARTAVTADDDLDRMFARIQNYLFDLGADLATPESDTALPYAPTHEPRNLPRQNIVHGRGVPVVRLHGDFQIP